MASLRANGRVADNRISSGLGRAMSLFLFALLLTGGWIALSYFRSVNSPKTQRAGEPDRGLQPIFATPQQPPSQPILVYSYDGDHQYYHTAAHSTGHSGRNALSEEAAREQGLKPCPICIRSQ